ncbi:MAG: hypothetical protein ACR2G9_01035, partial [Gaiellaceae bacterium]
MSPAQLFALAGGVEPLDCVLANRLQHPIALIREARQSLLDQRLEGVEIGTGDLLGGRERAAAGEDREAGKELLLLGREEVVAPLDRRSQRLLTRIGVAAALQQIEALGETLQDL